MLDEDTGLDPRVISASIADPYLLLIRDDTSISVWEMDKSNDLGDLDRDDPALSGNSWLSGCLYHDQDGVFSERTEKGAKSSGDIIMFLLSALGALYVSATLAGSPALALTCHRCTVCRIYQNQSTSRKGCRSFLLIYQLTMQRGKALPGTLSLSCWWQIWVTRLTSLPIS